MRSDNKNNNEYVDIDKEALSLATEICEKQQEILQLQRMQLIVQEYKNSTDKALVEFAEKFLDGKNKEDSKSKFFIGQASERQVNDIQNILGLNVSDYANVLPADTVRHIDNRHGANGEHDKSMSDPCDIGRLMYCLTFYDNVKQVDDDRFLYDSSGSFAKTVEYSKRINGTVYVLQVVPDSKKKEMIIRTAYKEKAKEKTAVKQLPIVEGDKHRMYKPSAYVRNELTTSSNHSIPQNRKKVNRLKKKGNDDREL